MAFCKNCGVNLIDGAKFCQKCGRPTTEKSTASIDKRHQEFSGKIYKCPNCGEPLNSFETVCPACGLELRGVKASSAVREFALKLEAIEERREPEVAKGIFARAAAQQEISKTDAQKINLIQSFAIPNAKEDILEFMILASTNIRTSEFGATNENKSEKAIAEAWLSKVKQTYSKACSAYNHDEDFQPIEDLYRNCLQDVKKQKKKRVIKYTLLFGWIPLLYVIMIPFLIISTENTNKSEITRLDGLVEEIKIDLQNGEYKLAMMNALSIEYEGNDKEQERKWPIQRTYWIEKILDEAAKNGVDLEYMIPEETEQPQESEVPEETSSQGFFSGFVQGFQNALNPSHSPSN